MLSDAAYMDRALFHAGRARGCTTPNPMVGAVVVSADGVVVGTGFHEKAGEPHAEVHALRAAGVSARGATLYCTLEPCCHHGRTPPCVDAITAAGITRVVVAVEDPNPRVSGGGARLLRDRGVRVEVGLRRDEAVRLNRAFFSAMQRGRPWVIAKIATSLDGYVTSGIGQHTALTSTEANRQSQQLRAEVDAIAVGSETLLVDDPRLTVHGVYRHRPFARVVFDRRLRTPIHARVLQSLASGPVLVVTTERQIAARPDEARALEHAGATLVALPADDLGTALAALLRFDIQSVLLEGGPAVHRAAWEAGCVDSVRVIVTPRTLGPAGVPWMSAAQLSLAALGGLRIEPCGPDVVIEGDVHRTG